jgi:hypothetical protein
MTTDRTHILSAIEHGRPYSIFDHIVAAAAVESLILQEQKRAVEKAFRMAQELSPEQVIAKMFPSTLERADEVIRHLSSPPAPHSPSAG